jgi:pyruvate kinase
MAALSASSATCRGRKSGSASSSGKITLVVGEAFVLDAQCALGNQERVGLDYKDLPKDVVSGDILLLDDGRLKLQVTGVRGHEIQTRVLVGGDLSNNKGINRQGGGLTAPALTAKDMDDIKTAAQIGVDFVAVSFPKSAADMYMARQLLRRRQHRRTDRQDRARRGDHQSGRNPRCLRRHHGCPWRSGRRSRRCHGPRAAEKMIRMARDKNKLTITATQMMESMILSPVPTRAEVSDVANAVLDGTDAVMLSAETAAGKYPVEVVESMARICVEAERSAEITLDREFLDRVFTRIDQSISMAAIWTAHHLKVKAIAALTQSGSTALWMSRMNSGVPIYALTPDAESVGRMVLYRGVCPLLMNQQHTDRDLLLAEAEQLLIDRGVVAKGELIALTIGEPIGCAGGTNTLKIVRVGEHQVA